MTAPETAPSTIPILAPSARLLARKLAVYLQPRVLIVLFLGFSAGLPLALSGSTLLVWMREVRRRSRHHRSVCPGRHALHDQVPVGAAGRCARRAGASRAARAPARLAGVLATAADRRDRAARLTDPARSPWFVALGALLVATASATQDIVVDAFRIESLPESEQAAGMASYVAAYRIGMLVSTAGALFLVSGFESTGLARSRLEWGYVAMAALVLIGMATALVATEPEKSAARGSRARERRDRVRARRCRPRSARSRDFLTRDMAIVALAFVVLFKFTDAFAGAMTAPFVIDLGFLPQRIRRHHQGRRAGRDAARRLCRRLRRARLSAGHEPVDRRHPAGGRQSVVLLAGDGRHNMGC